MLTHRIGLVGGGVAGSLSPTVHEAEAVALGFADYRYEILDIEVLGRLPEDTGDVVREAVRRGFTGFNITHPCKQAVIAGLDTLDIQAAAVGAVNTVVVGSDGRLVGHNTDYSGFLAALRAGLLPRADLAEVVLTGAGGAGSAVGHALATAGVGRLDVADVKVGRAVELAAAVTRQHGIEAEGIGPDVTASRVAAASGVVNASPIGMEGFAGTPFDVAPLRADHWVADIVYRPVSTALLAAARERGCPTLDGAQMLVEQAADTFSLVTGITPDRARMRRHLQDVLQALPAHGS